MSEIARVSVRILDKEYHVACPTDERTALLDSAELLNSKMREVRDSGKVVGLDRIAVIAALNMANELLIERGAVEGIDSTAQERIKACRERVEEALEKARQLQL